MTDGPVQLELKAQLAQRKEQLEELSEAVFSLRLDLNRLIASGFERGVDAVLTTTNALRTLIRRVTGAKDGPT